jgi:hypothetical protein
VQPLPRARRMPRVGSSHALRACEPCAWACPVSGAAVPWPAPARRSLVGFGMCVVGESDVKRLDSMSSITFDDFSLFWQALASANLTSRVGKFWFLIKPVNRNYVELEGVFRVPSLFCCSTAFRRRPALARDYSGARPGRMSWLLWLCSHVMCAVCVCVCVRVCVCLSRPFPSDRGTGALPPRLGLLPGQRLPLEQLHHHSCSVCVLQLARAGALPLLPPRNSRCLYFDPGSSSFDADMRARSTPQPYLPPQPPPARWERLCFCPCLCVRWRGRAPPRSPWGRCGAPTWWTPSRWWLLRAHTTFGPFACPTLKKSSRATSVCCDQVRA